MSPEQAKGLIDKMGPTSDVYSLGATLYCILTGRPPIPSDDREYMRNRIETGDFPRPRQVNPQVPAPLDAICLKAMALRPTDRYPSAQALAADVERWLADEPVSAFPEPLRVRTRRWVSRHRTLVSTAAATLLVATAGLVAYRDSQRRLERSELAGAMKDLAIDSDKKANQLRIADTRQNFDQHFRQGLLELERSGDLEKARGELGIALAIAEKEPSLRMSPGYDDIQTEVDAVDEKLRDKKKRSEEQADLAKLEQHWATAIFHSPFGPYDILVNAQQKSRGLSLARESASSALALYSVSTSPEANLGFQKKLDGSHHSAEEKRKIRDRCYEMMLILADSTARPASAEDDHRATAESALRILEQVPKELGALTQAYFLLRNTHLRSSGKPISEPEPVDTAMIPKIPTAFDRFHSGKTHLEKHLLAKANGNESGKAREELALAIGEFEQALRLEPKHFWAQYLAAICHLNNEGHPELHRAQLAKAHLMACVNQHQNFRGMHLLRAIIDAKLGDFAAAEADFQTVLNNPDEFDPPLRYVALLNRAAMKSSQQRRQESVEDLQTAIQLLPTEYQAHQNLGVEFSEQGNWTAAVEQFDKAIALRPELVDPYYERALALFRLDRGREANSSLDLAIARRADNRFFLLKAGILLHLGRPEEAVKAISSMQQTKVSMAESRLLANLLYEMVADPKLVERLQTYLNATANSIDPNILYLRGLLAAENGLHSLGARDLAQSLTIDASREPTPEMRSIYAWLILRQGDHQAALREFNSVIRDHRNHADAYFGRGLARALMGQTEAIVDAEAGLKLTLQPSDCDYFKAGRIYFVLIRSANGNLEDRYFFRGMDLLQQALDVTEDGKAFYENVIKKDPQFRAFQQIADRLQLKRP